MYWISENVAELSEIKHESTTFCIVNCGRGAGFSVFNTPQSGVYAEGKPPGKPQLTIQFTVVFHSPHQSNRLIFQANEYGAPI